MLLQQQKKRVIARRTSTGSKKCNNDHGADKKIELVKFGSQSGICDHPRCTTAWRFQSFAYCNKRTGHPPQQSRCATRYETLARERAGERSATAWHGSEDSWK